MEPLSTRKRKIYFYGLTLVFVIVIPIVLLYADGYRLGKNWQLLETGGIKITSSEAGASYYINGKLKTEDSFLASTFFVQELRPREYTIDVKKDGFIPWEKKITVGKQIVSEGYALLLPEKIDAVAVAPTMADSDGRQVSNPDFASATALFAASSSDALTPDQMAASPEIPADARLRDSVAFWKDGSNLIAAWLGDQDEIPYFFCTDECHPAVAVATASSAVLSDDFYPDRNDAIIFSTAAGVYAAEIDQRDPRAILPICLGANSGERIASDGTLYISKPDGTYIKISL